MYCADSPMPIKYGSERCARFRSLGVVQDGMAFLGWTVASDKMGSDASSSTVMQCTMSLGSDMEGVRIEASVEGGEHMRRRQTTPCVLASAVTYNANSPSSINSTR